MSKQARKVFKLPKRNPSRRRKKTIKEAGDHRFFGLAEFVVMALVATLVFLAVVMVKFIAFD